MDAALRSELDKALEDGEPGTIQELALRIGLEAEDARWAEVSCAHLARHRNAGVRGDALAALGQLARHESVRRQAEAAASDMETYLAWRFDRPAP